ncbi:Oxysterol-binding protein 3 [Dispira parvispora]|uniref:Oxysterol-binding protein 3 n=1 Tax=Dispira parvispora TaxID=1520584 RepID=A0A9W8AZK8_9FUNG|nr:Oxysterol-binding protein 3 [Dispira parvispora]
MQEIEIPPKDLHFHYVRIDIVNQKILWWFSTKRKNVSFGLFYKQTPEPLPGGVIVAETAEGLPVSRRQSMMHAQKHATNALTERLGSGTETSQSSAGSHLTTGTVSLKSAPEAFHQEGLGHGNAATLPSRRQKARASSTAYAAAKLLGLVEVLPIEHYESSKATIRGEYIAPKPGTYVLCFDNTFSISTSKVLHYSVGVTRPGNRGFKTHQERSDKESTESGTPPVTPPFTDVTNSAPGEAHPNSEGPMDSTRSLPSTVSRTPSSTTPSRQNSDPLTIRTNVTAQDVHPISRASIHIDNHESAPDLEGWLLKKKRKKIQGWAKRWVKLHRGVLSYAKSEDDVIRGAVQVAMAVVSTVPKQRLINVDSGTTLYQFRALNDSDYSVWFTALQEVKDHAHHWGVPLSARPSIADLPQGSATLGGSGVQLNEVSVLQSPVMADIKNIRTSQIAYVLQETHVGAVRELEQAQQTLARLRQEICSASEATQLQSLTTLVQDLESHLGQCRSYEQWYYGSLWELSRAYTRSKSRFASRHSLQRANSNVLSRTPSLLRNRSHSQLAGEPGSPSPAIATLDKHGVGDWPHSPHGVQTPSGYVSARASIDNLAEFASVESDDDLFFDAMDASLIEDVVVAPDGAMHSGETDQADQDSDSSEIALSATSTSDDAQPQQRVPSDDSRTVSVKSLTGDSLPPTRKERAVRFATTVDEGRVQRDHIKNFHRRTTLPSPVCCEPANIISILRKNIGKDLSSVAMPISLNEPINVLQSLCEELEYVDLVHQAAKCQDSLDRLMFVVAFTVSPFASRVTRGTRKPFNPLLGETYELDLPEKGFRYFAEKVSHHPPVMACHAIGSDFTWWQDTKVKNKFWGKSMELMSEGMVHLQLTAFGDHFTYTKPSTWVRNMMSTNKYLEFSGKVEVVNHTTGDVAHVVFKESGYFSSSNNEVTATLYRGVDGKVPKILSQTPVDRRLSGRWSQELMWERTATEMSLLWRANPPSPNTEDMYGFTPFTMVLNEITPDLLVDPKHDLATVRLDSLPNDDSKEQVVSETLELAEKGKFNTAPTDTRLRPDQRLFELGLPEQAETEKLRLEQKQRDVRQTRQQDQQPWEPRWFTLQVDSVTGENQWVYNNQYWSQRDTQSLPSDVWLW